MSKIPIEIREAAEAYAIKHISEPQTRGGADREVAVREAFEACYKFLTSQEPDGWCAWHPERGWLTVGTARFVSTDFDSALEELKAAFELNFEMAKVEIGANFDIDLSQWLHRTGWLILPVRLLKCGGEA